MSDTSKTPFPKLAAPALRALAAAGYTHLEQLAGVSEAELAKLHGMGPNALAKLRQDLNRIKARQEEAKRAETQLDRRVNSFSHSYMSDSKWRRAFRILGENLPNSRCKWKFIDDERVWKTAIPSESDIEQGHFESSYGVFCLKHIEWLEILTDEPSYLSQKLKLAGLFETEETKNGLKIFGYR